MRKMTMSDPSMSIFVPHVSVGPYRFGDRIDGYLVREKLKLKERDDEFSDCDMYLNENESMAICVNEQNIIDRVLCDAEFFYKGRNIIGMSLEEVVDFLGQQPDDFHDPIEMPDGSVEAGVYFFGLGLALGLRNDRHGPVENAYAYVDEDDEE